MKHPLTETGYFPTPYNQVVISVVCSLSLPYMHMFPQSAPKAGAVSNLQRTLSEHGSRGSGLPNPGFHFRQQSVRLALGAPCTSKGKRSFAAVTPNVVSMSRSVIIITRL